MGGGKGSKTTTTTQTNPMQALQMPYVQQGWETAKQLYDRQQQYPGSTIADRGLPYLQSGLNLQGELARELHQEWQPRVYEGWLSAADQRYTDSPAYNYYQNMAQNQTGPQQQYGAIGQQAQQAGQNFSNQIQAYAPQIAGYAGQAGANNNLGMSQLGQTAQGNYLNGNPWFAQMVQNAMDPVTRNYQTAISPQIDASFMNSGRYGSGAMLGQRENAQNTLADNLAKMSQNMYGQNYANERQQQLAAAQNYGQLYNQGLGAAMQGLAGAANVQQGAANTYQQGLTQAMNALAPQLNAMTAGAQGLQGGYQAGLSNQLNAANLYPQLAQANFIPSQMVQEMGKGLNAIQQQYIDEPYNMLDRYLKQIGAVQGGSSTTTSPYFTNPMANAMAGITGGMDIMQKMGGMGGLGGSSMGGYPATVNSPSGTWVNGTGMGSGIYTNMSNGITSDQSGSGFPGIGAVGSGLSTLGSIGGMMGGWIVCTELVRQGRMPKRYWACGSCAFAAYPEVGKRGYHFWGIPLVKHLRRKPYSLLSRVACAAFNWRAEDLAARRGVKGARKLWRGRMVTWALYPICMALGMILPAQDWQQVYRDDAGSRAAG